MVLDWHKTSITRLQQQQQQRYNKESAAGKRSGEQNVRRTIITMMMLLHTGVPGGGCPVEPTLLRGGREQKKGRPGVFIVRKYITTTIVRVTYYRYPKRNDNGWHRQMESSSVAAPNSCRTRRRRRRRIYYSAGRSARSLPANTWYIPVCIAVRRPGSLRRFGASLRRREKGVTEKKTVVRCNNTRGERKNGVAGRTFISTVLSG